MYLDSSKYKKKVNYFVHLWGKLPYSYLRATSFLRFLEIL